jgi:heme/copper-type cytochrome/quinol oxidase subunit 2
LGRKNQILEAANNSKPFIFPHPEKDLLFPKRDLQETTNDKNSASFSIIAKKFEFIPNRITVKQGQKVTLDIKSIDVPHGFALPEYHIVEELLPQKIKRIEFVANRKGIFPFLCSVYCGHDGHSGHSHMSMVGELIVQ